MVSRPPTGVGGVLKSLRRGGRSRVAYRPPSAAEAQAHRDWVMRVATAAARGAGLPATATDPANFESRVLSNKALWLLSERHDARRGAGAVVLRAGPASDLIVEAPHSFFDAGTLPLALDLFERLSARALLINTVHRARGLGAPPDEAAIAVLARSGRSPSDVAHATRSFALSAHVGLVEALPGISTVQLHGFRDGNARGHAAVASAARTGWAVEPLADALSRAFSPLSVGAFPRDLRVLGGTHNRQAGASRARGARMLHLELSHALRQRLQSDSSARATLAETLARFLR